MFPLAFVISIWHWRFKTTRQLSTGLPVARWGFAPTVLTIKTPDSCTLPAGHARPRFKRVAAQLQIDSSIQDSPANEVNRAVFEIVDSAYSAVIRSISLGEQTAIIGAINSNAFSLVEAWPTFVCFQDSQTDNEFISLYFLRQNLCTDHWKRKKMKILIHGADVGWRYPRLLNQSPFSDGRFNHRREEVGETLPVPNPRSSVLLCDFER